ncbi:MAG: hypothetical protein Q9169_005005 [Polycauliona sp. 2 TL-2023]
MSYLEKFKKALHSNKERIKAATSKHGGSKNAIDRQTEGSALGNESKQPQAILKAPLLERLPFEIRLQIWEEVLGGNLFHMQAKPPSNNLYQTIDEPSDAQRGWQRQNPNFGRYLCCNFSTDTTTDGQAAYPRCQGSQVEPCFFCGPEASPFNPLSLLLTCRQIHNEAVEFLYSTNTFSFDDDLILHVVSSLDSGRHFNQIRTVHVNISLWKLSGGQYPGLNSNEVGDAFRHNWARFWLLLLQLERLRHVRLDIYGTSKLGLQTEDLDPVRQLRGLKTFDLALWHDATDSDAWEPAADRQDMLLSVPLQESIRRIVCE